MFNLIDIIRKLFDDYLLLFFIIPVLFSILVIILPKEINFKNEKNIDLRPLILILVSIPLIFTLIDILIIPYQIGELSFGIICIFFAIIMLFQIILISHLTLKKDKANNKDIIFYSILCIIILIFLVLLWQVCDVIGTFESPNIEGF
jgi:hypothetical protein